MIYKKHINTLDAYKKKDFKRIRLYILFARKSQETRNETTSNASTKKSDLVITLSFTNTYPLIKKKSCFINCTSKPRTKQQNINPSFNKNQKKMIYIY